MHVEAPIRRGDQRAIEPRLAAARLIAGDEDDRLPDRVECEGCAPSAARGIETQFLHVGVFRTVQRIHMWTPELWAKALEHPRPGEQGRLDFARECCEFGGERLIEKHDPSHRADISRRNMFWKTYFCRRRGKARRGARGCSEDSPMTKFGEDPIQSAREALAIAKGEAAPARVYDPKSIETGPFPTEIR